MLENDLVGVGAGPTNFSLAALIETASARGSIHLQSKFFGCGISRQGYAVACGKYQRTASATLTSLQRLDGTLPF